MKIIVVTLFFYLLIPSLYAKEISPTLRLKTSDTVTDFVIDKDTLYASTVGGTIDIFSLQSMKMIDQIKIDDTLSALGKVIPTRIYCVDRFKDKTLFVASGTYGYREVYLHVKGTTTKIIDTSQKLFIKEARFVDDETILFGTFASELIIYKSEEKFILYNEQISQSRLSDIALSEDKRKVATVDESGEVHIVDTASSKVIHSPKAQNLDNVYKVAYVKDVVISAGQDRRVGVYPFESTPYYIKSDFLVYCVGLSPSAKLGIYSSGEDNNLQIFDVTSKQKKDLLVGHKSRIHTLYFSSEHDLFSAGEEATIFYWKF